jgi:hypothetical protein
MSDAFHPDGVTPGMYVYVEHAKSPEKFALVHKPMAIFTVCVDHKLADLQKVKAGLVENMFNLVEWCSGCFLPNEAYEVDWPDETYTYKKPPVTISEQYMDVVNTKTRTIKLVVGIPHGAWRATKKPSIWSRLRKWWDNLIYTYDD